MESFKTINADQNVELELKSLLEDTRMSLGMLEDDPIDRHLISQTLAKTENILFLREWTQWDETSGITEESAHQALGTLQRAMQHLQSSQSERPSLSPLVHKVAALLTLLFPLSCFPCGELTLVPGAPY